MLTFVFSKGVKVETIHQPQHHPRDAFLLVIAKLEERRLGYEVFSLSQKNKALIEDEKMHEMRLAKLTRPVQIEKSALQKSDFKRLTQNQIIHLVKEN